MQRIPFTPPRGQRSCFTFLPPASHSVSAQNPESSSNSFFLAVNTAPNQSAEIWGFFRGKSKVSPYDQAVTSLGCHCSPEGSASPNPTSHLRPSPLQGPNQVQAPQLFLRAREQNRIKTEQTKWWLKEGNLRAHRSNKHFSVLISWSLKRPKCETGER